LNGEGTGQIYKVGFTGGSVANGTFLSPVSLPAAEKTTTSFPQTFRSYQVQQYNAQIIPSSPSGTVYGVSIQSLEHEGFTETAMGHWKYLGPYQPGYFSGTQIAGGSFLLGTPTATSAISTIQSGTYAGYSQSQIEAYAYADNFDELRASTSVIYDKTNGALTIQLSNLEYWSAASMNAENSSMLDMTASVYLPSTLSCATTITPGTNSFTCTMDYSTTGYTATFQGKFFGSTGNEIGGTFAIQGLFIASASNVAAGAFIAKHN
jgi:hypothetical protein